MRRFPDLPVEEDEEQQLYNELMEEGMTPAQAEAAIKREIVLENDAMVLNIRTANRRNLLVTNDVVPDDVMVPPEIDWTENSAFDQPCSDCPEEVVRNVKPSDDNNPADLAEEPWL